MQRSISSLAIFAIKLNFLKNHVAVFFVLALVQLVRLRTNRAYGWMISLQVVSIAGLGLEVSSQKVKCPNLVS